MGRRERRDSAKVPRAPPPRHGQPNREENEWHSVTSQPGIGFAAPTGDAADHMSHPLDTERRQCLSSRMTALTMVTVHDDVSIERNVRRGRIDGSEWNQPG